MHDGHSREPQTGDASPKSLLRKEIVALNQRLQGFHDGQSVDFLDLGAAREFCGVFFCLACHGDFVIFCLSKKVLFLKELGSLSLGIHF